MLDYTKMFWLDLAKALNDPEFKQAFMDKLREMSEEEGTNDH